MASRHIKIDKYEMHTLTGSFSAWYCTTERYRNESVALIHCRFRAGGELKLEEAELRWDEWHLKKHAGQKIEAV